MRCPIINLINSKYVKAQPRKKTIGEQFHLFGSPMLFTI